MDSKWRVFITSGPLNKDYLEAEIWYGDEQWAILTEFGKTIFFYPRMNNEPWIFNLDDVLVILQKLKEENFDGTVE
jgi:hypothetical protein